MRANLPDPDIDARVDHEPRGRRASAEDSRQQRVVPAPVGDRHGAAHRAARGRPDSRAPRPTLRRLWSRSSRTRAATTRTPRQRSASATSPVRASAAFRSTAASRVRTREPGSTTPTVSARASSPRPVSRWVNASRYTRISTFAVRPPERSRSASRTRARSCARPPTRPTCPRPWHRRRRNAASSWRLHSSGRGSAHAPISYRRS